MKAALAFLACMVAVTPPTTEKRTETLREGERGQSSVVWTGGAEVWGGGRQTLYRDNHATLVAEPLAVPRYALVRRKLTDRRGGWSSGITLTATACLNAEGVLPGCDEPSKPDADIDADAVTVARFYWSYTTTLYETLDDAVKASDYAYDGQFAGIFDLQTAKQIPVTFVTTTYTQPERIESRTWDETQPTLSNGARH